MKTNSLDRLVEFANTQIEDDEYEGSDVSMTIASNLSTKRVIKELESSGELEAVDQYLKDIALPHFRSSSNVERRKIYRTRRRHRSKFKCWFYRNIGCHYKKFAAAAVCVAVAVAVLVFTYTGNSSNHVHKPTQLTIKTTDTQPNHTIMASVEKTVSAESNGSTPSDVRSESYLAYDLTDIQVIGPGDVLWDELSRVTTSDNSVLDIIMLKLQGLGMDTHNIHPGDEIIYPSELGMIKVAKIIPKHQKAAYWVGNINENTDVVKEITVKLVVNSDLYTAALDKGIDNEIWAQMVKLDSIHKLGLATVAPGVTFSISYQKRLNDDLETFSYRLYRLTKNGNVLWDKGGVEVNEKTNDAFSFLVRNKELDGTTVFKAISSRGFVYSRAISMIDSPSPSI